MYERYNGERARPWEMTRAEFNQWLAERSRAMRNAVNDHEYRREGVDLMDQLTEDFGPDFPRGHQGAIKDAHERGEIIPDRVLWNYPRLAHELYDWPMPTAVWQTTVDGFLSIINASDKTHGSDIFDRATLESMTSYLKKERFTDLMSTLEVPEGTVEIRAEWEKAKYVKTDEDGEIVRDHAGLATYLSDEEIKGKGRMPYRLTIAAFLGDQPLGHIGDSFGATELMIAPEFRGRGIGTALEVAFRTHDPFRPSGGLSGAGEECVRAAHRELIRIALEAGKPVPEAVVTSQPALKRQRSRKQVRAK